LKDNLIENYLALLKNNLCTLTDEERQLCVSEIKDHLYEKINEKKQSGLTNKEAISITLNEFEDPVKLADRYIQEFGKTYRPARTSSFFMISFILTGLGFLMLPIFEGYFEWAYITIASIVILLSTPVLYFRKLFSEEIKLIKSLSKILIYLHFPISILLFWIRNNIEGQIHMFSLYYLVIYLFLIGVIFVFINYVVYKSKE
jgi:hypothetical protein